MLVELGSLIEHRQSVPWNETVEATYERFREHDHEFAAVLQGPKYVGMVSRGQIGVLLGTRFGFALNARQPIHQHLMPDILQVAPGCPLLDLLEKALSRTGEAFYNDAALVEKDDTFLGIISVQLMVRLQTQLMSEQMRLAEQQRLELLTKNQQLFRSLNELRQSQGRYEKLFQNSALGVALLNTESRVEACNQRLATWLAGPAGPSVLPGTLGELIPAKERAQFLQLLHQHETEPEGVPSQEREFILELPGGRPRLFKFFTSWIQETGEICVVLHDITEQRALERKIALREKSALFESLVGGIAHEVNNKLSPVLGYADLLAMELRTLDGGHPELVDYCKTISSSAKESANIVRQLLQISRPPAAELIPVNLNTIVSEVSAILRYRLRAVGANLSLNLPAHEVTVLADLAQIKQVVINLMMNALDAMERAAKKDLVLTVRAEGSHASLYVADTGHGIQPEHLTRVFDPFFTTKGPDRGTGLGLSVCLSIIKQHNGDIQVRSTPGEGSVFQIYLPLASPAVAWEGVAAPSRMVAGVRSNSPVPAAFTRLEVMVVDDEEFVAGFVQEVLRRRMGWRVQRTSNGRRAIERLQENQFDIIISDVRMPELDGLALFQWIKDFKPALVARTLFLTGDAGGAELDKELETFGAPVLRKPFTPEALVEKCQQLLVV